MSVYQIELLLYFNQIAPKNTKRATTKKSLWPIHKVIFDTKVLANSPWKPCLPLQL
jgi:hypothetical protein